MLEFQTPIKVSYSKNGKEISGKATIKWTFDVCASDWGIKWLSISVPNQTISVDFKEEIYNEDLDRDEDMEWTEELALEDVEVDGKRFTTTQDICPEELVIPAKGKSYLIFQEGED